MKLSEHSRLVTFAILGALILAGAGQAISQTSALQERIAAVKESLLKSQTLLRQYEWTETRVLSLKGEERSRIVSRCSYGADGNVQKVLVSQTPEEKAGGLKGKIIEKKRAEIKAYMQSATDLMKSYVLPDPARIEAAWNAGKTSVTKAEPRGRLDIPDYEKPGDVLSIEIDMEKNTLLGLTVATWMKDAKDKVTLSTAFASLDDGATYPAEIILIAPSQSLEVKTTNSDYKKVSAAKG
ncbi:MAG: hypothetical protein KBD56_05470 [Candidatus Eisenbacteria bacterium]|nr:hypothetical protein [Candidatus Eisenbacteria bacterium]